MRKDAVVGGRSKLRGRREEEGGGGRKLGEEEGGSREEFALNEVDKVTFLEDGVGGWEEGGGG